MSPTIEVQEDTCIVRLKGRFVTGSDEEYRSVRQQLTHIRCRALLLDCREVPYLDSTGINFVLGVWRVVTEAGGQFGLVGPNGRVREVLRICQLDRHIPIVQESAVVGQASACAGL